MEQNKKRKKSQLNKTPLPNLFAVLRIIISAALLIVSATVITSAILRQVLLILSLLICGFDLIFSLIDDIKKKDYFSSSAIILIAVLFFYLIGCHYEAAIGLIVFLLGKTMYDYSVGLAKHSFFKNAAEDEADISKLKAIMALSLNQSSTYEEKIKPYFDVFEKSAIVLGLLFAIVMPLISDMTYVMSIRRGIMLIAASFPFTIFFTVRFGTSYAYCLSAKYGVKIQNKAAFEKLKKLEIVIFDKTDVFSDGLPKMSSVSSPIFDSDKFLMLAAHIATNSQQKIAVPIINSYGGEIKREVISDFSDFPGCGMEASINGVKVLLANKELLAVRGITLTSEQIKKGYVLYMIIGNRYAGSITFNEKINPYASAVVSDLKEMGGIKSVLLTEDSNEFSEKLADALGVDEVYGECDELAKIKTVQEYAESKTNGSTIMYVNGDNTGLHSAADIDVKVCSDPENADIITDNIGLFGLPVTYFTALNSNRIIKENIIFAVIIKVLMVVLAITGNATLWFILLLEFSAGIGSVINTSRLSDFSKKNE